MSVYLDTSVLVPRFLSEATTSRVRAFLRSVGKPMLVGDLTAAEFASAVSRQVRTKDITQERAFKVLREYDDWRAAFAVAVYTGAPDIEKADVFVRRFELKLQAPDAIHVAVASRLGATLVTLDARQADAAETLGVAVDRLGA